MPDLAHRVAWRKQAAFFEVGDIILFGKYKNKKGKIVGFGMNEKGQPTVEIEPIPKGRKKNKTMGLFKIWSLSKKEEALAKKKMEEAKKAMTTINAARVAARYLKARTVGMGETATKGTLRVHRFRSSLHIWDLTNAGKRGKKVRRMSLGVDPYYYKGDEQKWLSNMAEQALDYGNYDRFKAFVSDLQVDFPSEISMEEYQERAIDVLPAETRTIKLEWSVGTDQLRLTASPLEFRVVSSVEHERDDRPSFRQDTMYSNVKRPDATKFYGWLLDNESKVKRMSIMDLRDLWKKLGVRYDYH